MADTFQRVRADVDLDAILHNARKMREGLSPQTRMMAVVKTDGYGHGSVPIARLLEAEDFIYGFAVATPEEAFALRDHGIKKPILILGYTFPYAYERMAGEGIRGTVFAEGTLPEMSRAAKAAGKPLKVHIKVDTGMGRVGIRPDDEGLSFVRALKEYARDGSLEIEGIFTHFAKADERDLSETERQLKLFREFTERIGAEEEIDIPIKHCANSATILRLREAQMNVVRAGIALYGLSPSDEVPADGYGLRPALSLHSRVVYVKTLRKGQSVSYGGLFTAEHDMRIATVPVGYGDGYPRSLSCGKGYVLIRGERAPILGRVCMDQFMADVSGISDVAAGDAVTLLGSDGGERITAEQLGAWSGRFDYELVCDLNRRVPRVFYREGRIVGILDSDGFRGEETL
ncbi:MAG: alanine racemase [Clostridium sp.]|nr:alanine racemase [Acetatifactor muris]MCM1563354.1 alanine racemase [Clostridium sp.]